MEIRQRVQEITVEDGWALIDILQVPDQPGIAAQIFGAIADSGLSVDMIVQNAGLQRKTDVSLTVREEDAGQAVTVLKGIQSQIEAKDIELKVQLAKVQLVGTGILSDPSYVGHLFSALADAEVNILCIGTSEVRISCLVDSTARHKAKRALGNTFRAEPRVNNPT
ncbi:ACT domain-containing protein [Dehalococcoidia bacterium]|nr:ACT domain-containing protein [Dehalococcoidia bacterium]